MYKDVCVELGCADGTLFLTAKTEYVYLSYRCLSSATQGSRSGSKLVCDINSDDEITSLLLRTLNYRRTVA